MTHQVCDAVLVRGEWSQVAVEGAVSREWSSSAVSMLRRHGGLSAVAAGRAVLGGGAGHGVLERLASE